MKKKKISGLMLFATTVMMLLCLTGCGFIGSKKPYVATVTDSVRLKTDSTYDKADSVLILNLDVENKSKDYLDPTSVAYDASASLDGTPLDMEYLSDYCPVYVSTNAIAPKEHGTVQVAFKLGSPDADGTVSVLMLSYGKKKSDEATSPSAAHLTLFQDGVELSYSYLPYRHPEADDELSDNSYKDIQPGKSISYRSIYTLQDDSEVEFIAKESTYTGYEIEPILETKIAVAEDIFQESYTLDEIVEETIRILGDDDEVLDEDALTL